MLHFCGYTLSFEQLGALLSLPAGVEIAGVRECRQGKPEAVEIVLQGEKIKGVPYDCTLNCVKAEFKRSEFNPTFPDGPELIVHMQGESND